MLAILLSSFTYCLFDEDVLLSVLGWLVEG